MRFQSQVFVFGLIYVTLHMCHGFTDEEKANAVKLLENMAETRKGLGALREVIAGIDSDLMTTQKRWAPGCNVGAGMPGYQCHLAVLRSDAKNGNWLQSSQLSPGKRGQSEVSHNTKREAGSDAEEAIWRVRDLQTKRKGLDVLKKILSEMDADLLLEQKRTCALNLGGHCATESAASVADQWHYLNSPLSPGRKRRDTGLFKKLISGELLDKKTEEKAPESS